MQPVSDAPDHPLSGAKHKLKNEPTKIRVERQLQIKTTSESKLELRVTHRIKRKYSKQAKSSQKLQRIITQI